MSRFDKRFSSRKTLILLSLLAIPAVFAFQNCGSGFRISDLEQNSSTVGGDLPGSDRPVATIVSQLSATAASETEFSGGESIPQITATSPLTKDLITVSCSTNGGMAAKDFALHSSVKGLELTSADTRIVHSGSSTGQILRLEVDCSAVQPPAADVQITLVFRFDNSVERRLVIPVNVIVPSKVSLSLDIPSQVDCSARPSDTLSIPFRLTSSASESNESVVRFRIEPASTTEIVTAADFTKPILPGESASGNLAVNCSKIQPGATASVPMILKATLESNPAGYSAMNFNLLFSLTTLSRPMPTINGVRAFVLSETRTIVSLFGSLFSATGNKISLSGAPGCVTNPNGGFIKEDAHYIEFEVASQTWARDCQVTVSNGDGTSEPAAFSIAAFTTGPSAQQAIYTGENSRGSRIYLYGSHLSESGNVIHVTGDAGCQVDLNSPLTMESGGLLIFEIPSSSSARKCTVSLVTNGVALAPIVVEIPAVDIRPRVDQISFKGIRADFRVAMFEVVGSHLVPGKNLITLTGETDCSGTLQSPFAMPYQWEVWEDAGGMSFSVPTVDHVRTCKIQVTTDGTPLPPMDVAIPAQPLALTEMVSSFSDGQLFLSIHGNALPTSNSSITVSGGGSCTGTFQSPFLQENINLITVLVPSTLASQTCTVTLNHTGAQYPSKQVLFAAIPPTPVILASKDCGIINGKNCAQLTGTGFLSTNSGFYSCDDNSSAKFNTPLLEETSTSIKMLLEGGARSRVCTITMSTTEGASTFRLNPFRVILTGP